MLSPRSTQTKKALSGLAWLPTLVLRISVGFMFFSGAVTKLTAPEQLVATLREGGIPLAGSVAPLLATVELVGGAALVLGLGTRVAALVLAGVMGGALITTIVVPLSHKYPAPSSFLSSLFYTPEWLLMLLLGWILCAGADRFSIDALLTRRHSPRATQP
ncbi:DoxX family protein [Streptomyces kronopolitis]|uniref:DoxX family protein n=1 Tax=Streptomyces kronopolitis TaxID=1612435 RepID=UPI003D97B8A3